MNWELCALCQCDSEDLLDPLDKFNTNVCGYKLLARNINAFLDAGLALPKKIKVSVEDLKGVTSIASNLRSHHGKWHKHCSKELSGSRLQRACANRDKQMETGNAENPAKKTRSNLCTEPPLRCPTCFFCDKKGTLTTDSNDDQDSSI